MKHEKQNQSVAMCKAYPSDLRDAEWAILASFSETVIEPAEGHVVARRL
jgi:hypothetical protein